MLAGAILPEKTAFPTYMRLRFKKNEEGGLAIQTESIYLKLCGPGPSGGCI
jgi:hypothetical protein